MTDSTAEPLASEMTGRIVDFARAGRSAARAVSLYPPGHPAIQGALDRLVAAANQATVGGALSLKILANALLVGDRAPARPDPALAEFAVLLHHHRIAGLVLHGGTDAESWRTLLLLLARAPEDVRADGGIAHLWMTAGGPSIEIAEIDYAELLRERLGDPAALETLLSWCVSESPTDLDPAMLEAIAGLVADGDILAELAATLERRTAGGSIGAQAAAILRLLTALTKHVARTRPDALATAFQQLGALLGRLPPTLVTQLITRPEARGAALDVAGGAVSLIGAVAQQVADGDAAHLVAETVISAGGATERLAEAFQTLAPDFDRKRRVLSLAEQEVFASELGQEESFPELWQRVEQMLTTYSDQPYVSDSYARELSALKARAVEVEQTSDDPPERITEWVSTVGDSALRALDIRLLADLLATEAEPGRWRELADMVVAHARDLARVGHFGATAEVLAPIVLEASDLGRPELRPVALAAVETLASGAFVPLAVNALKTADDVQAELVQRICHSIGPAVVKPLAEALAAEQDARARRHLREILIGFGARGRASVEQLMTASNWEVRRTAAYLLREFGGADSLQALEPLLNDADPRVQREAFRGLLLVGDERAAEMLLRVLERGSTHTRETLVAELSSLRNERAGPLCTYLVRRLSARRHADVYLAAIDALGFTGGSQAVEMLRDLLYRGEWWAPVRTRALRSAAATALRRIGGGAGLQILRDAAARAPRPVRTIARAELTRASEVR